MERGRGLKENNWKDEGVWKKCCECMKKGRGNIEEKKAGDIWHVADIKVAAP